MGDLIKADKARRIADEHNGKLNKDELVEVMEDIDEVSADGGYKTTHYKQLRPNTIDVLENLGYDIQLQQRNNDTYTTISWEGDEGKLDDEIFDNEVNGASTNDNIGAGELTYIDGLVEKFPRTVGFRKDMDIFVANGNGCKPFDVVLFQEGVKGGANWFYLENGEWVSGAYGKERYDYVDFISHVSKVHDHNIDWQNQK